MGGGGGCWGQVSKQVAPPGTRGGKHLHHAVPDAAACDLSLLPDAAGYMPIAPPDGATHAQYFCQILAPGLSLTHHHPCVLTLRVTVPSLSWTLGSNSTHLKLPLHSHATHSKSGGKVGCITKATPGPGK